MARKAKKRPAAGPPLNPRKWLGLMDAEEGDLIGVDRLLTILHREVSGLSYFAPLPLPVQTQLRTLADELKRVNTFVGGFIAADDFRAAQIANGRKAK